VKKILILFVSIILVFSINLFSKKGEEISVKEVVPFTYCAIFHQGPFTEIESVIQRLMTEIHTQGIIPQGPMIGVYYNSPEEVKPDELKWEIGFPVAKETNTKEPLELKEWNFTLVISAMHIGPYEKIAEIYPKIFEWMKKNNYRIIGPIMERYFDDPSTVKPEELRAEVWIPCEKIK
jgi:effector-binding domain-containing protein